MKQPTDLPARCEKEEKSKRRLVPKLLKKKLSGCLFSLQFFKAVKGCLPSQGHGCSVFKIFGTGNILMGFFKNQTTKFKLLNILKTLYP